MDTIPSVQRKSMPPDSRFSFVIILRYDPIAYSEFPAGGPGPGGAGPGPRTIPAGPIARIGDRDRARCARLEATCHDGSVGARLCGRLRGGRGPRTSPGRARTHHGTHGDVVVLRPAFYEPHFIRFL
jgi:hypothetical protein